MSRTYERLKELEKRRMTPANGEATPGTFEWGQVDRVQNIQDEADRLRRAIATLEAAMEDPEGTLLLEAPELAAMQIQRSSWLAPSRFHRRALATVICTRPSVPL